MITALALVAGSSVNFTDPIFQGMAISLASGVMVSTILTLVVIPLGCINAERALCQVAAAGCAPGTPLPEAILAVTAPVRQAAAPARKSSFSFSNLLFTVWAKVAGALMMVFYAIRGIFLLLGQMISKPAKPAPAPAASKPAPAPASPVVHSGPVSVTQPAPAPETATPGHPAVSAGPGVTKVITPAKATIVPPEPSKAPAAAPVAPPTAAVAATEPGAPRASVAANGKKTAAPAAAAMPSRPVKAEKAVEAAPALSAEGRAKASGRRGIRLKLIKPGENDSGLK
jgi:hypothetical protein